MPDTLPIDEVLKPFAGKRLKLYLAGVGGALDGYLEEDLGHGWSRFRQPAMELPNPMTGQIIEMPETTVSLDRSSIVMFEASSETAAAKLSLV